jgi:NitT/TauT family transport system substrate-binding protein
MTTCRSTFLSLAAAMILAVGGSFGASAQQLEKFTFALNWFAVGDHAAYWVALEKGYFRDRGLDVTLENSRGSGDSIAKVDTGRADAGLADAAVIVSSLARGSSVRIVGMVFDKTPLNIFSPASKPARTPADLIGRTIGAPPGDSQRQIWPAFVRATGIDGSRVEWVNVEPAAKIAALATGRVDTIADYSTGLPLYEKAMGQGNVVMMQWADFGLDMYSMSIMASDKTIRERPEVLRKFLEAAYMGWRDVMADPEGSMAIFKRRVPEVDVSVMQPNMMLGLALMRTDRYRANGIGSIDRAKMCASVDIINANMGLPRPVTCDETFNASFYTRVDMPPAR